MEALTALVNLLLRLLVPTLCVFYADVRGPPAMLLEVALWASILPLWVCRFATCMALLMALFNGHHPGYPLLAVVLCVLQAYLSEPTLHCEGEDSEGEEEFEIQWPEGDPILIGISSVVATDTEIGEKEVEFTVEFPEGDCEPEVKVA